MFDKHPGSDDQIACGCRYGVPLPRLTGASLSHKDFLVSGASRVDTKKTSINAAEVNRVISEALKVLAKTDSATAAAIIAKGLSLAKKKV